jgi:hypothetical protein
MRYDDVTGLPSLADGLSLASELGILQRRQRNGETLSEAEDARLRELEAQLAEAEERVQEPTPSQQAARAKHLRKLRRKQAAYMRADPRMRMQRYQVYLRRLALRRHAVERHEVRRRPALSPATVAPAFTAPRPRERKPGAQSRPRAPDDSREPPLCAGCDRPLDARRPNHKHHNGACRERARRKRRKQDEILVRYRDEIHKARRAGDLTEAEALELLIAPSERVLAMLAVAA